MKVGTDAVILGAAVNSTNSNRILDVGTGCGIIALMLAQKSNASIDAIDLDERSINQARENFQLSPWNSQLNAFHIDFSSFIQGCETKYDLVVCNPPFFTNGIRAEKRNRSIARHDDTLNFSELAIGVSKILNDSGHFWLIIPFDRFNECKGICEENQLYLNEGIEIYPKRNFSPMRSICMFSKKQKSVVNETQLVLRDEDGAFTSEYLFFMRNYYLDQPK